MIDLYYWTTPSGHKITIFLEEAGIEYNLIPINISRGDQFSEEFLRISPNNKIPAIVDHAPADGGEPLPVFESGAILLYLAEKYGKFIPSKLRGRYDVIQWLMWQMGGLGPMLGQNHHFVTYAPEKIPYAMDRYINEANRLYCVLDTQLQGREYITGEYSIADMASHPWTNSYKRQQIDLDEFPNVKRWRETMKARPAVARAYARADEINTTPTVSEEAKKVLFGQSAKTLRNCRRC